LQDKSLGQNAFRVLLFWAVSAFLLGVFVCLDFFAPKKFAELRHE